MGTATGSLRDKLKDIEAQQAELREERKTKVKARDDAREKFAESDSLGTDSAEFKAAEKSVGELGAIDDQLADLNSVHIGTLRMLGEDPAVRGNGRERDDTDRQRAGWESGHMFTDELRQALKYAANSKGHLGTVELGEAMTAEGFVEMRRQAFGAEPAISDQMRRGPYRGVIPDLRRPVSLLDLIPTGTMEGNSFPYTRESGKWDEGAPVKEGAKKPEASVTFEDDEAVARTIAEFMKIKKQSLADVPALRTIIDSRLRYGLERVLEAEILVGEGKDPELDGIALVSGIGVVKYVKDALIADQALKAITTILLENGRASAIVMNPLDWESAVKAKAAGGDEQYYGGGPFAVTPQQMWGVPIVPSPAVKAGLILAGDFTMGATLLVREGINVLMSDSDGEDFVYNRVTILAEMRAALAIWRPGMFAKVYLTEKAEEEKV